MSFLISFNVCNSYLQGKKDSGAFILLSFTCIIFSFYFVYFVCYRTDFKTWQQKMQCFIHIFFHKSDICCLRSSTGDILLYIPVWKNVVAKKYKPWRMRFQGFMGIWSLAKQPQSSFNKSLHCREMHVQIPRVLCLRHAVVFFVFQERF